MTREVSTVPELLFAFAPNHQRVAGLTYGTATPAERSANRAALQAALDAAVGGVLDLPAGRVIEVDDTLTLKGDIHLRGNGATLALGTDNLALYSLIFAGGHTLEAERLTLRGQPEAAVLAVGSVTTRAIACTAGARLRLSGLTYAEWFGEGIGGAAGVSCWLEDSTVQAWNQGIAGGDGALEYVIRGCTFGRVGAGLNTTHHLYINPDVWVNIEGCTFLNNEGETNWSLHYYGSDTVGPARTPIIRDSMFYRKAFSNEQAFTVFQNCVFYKTALQIQNNALIDACSFISDDPLDQASMIARTDRGQVITLRDVQANNAHFLCESPYPTGAYYRFENPTLRGASAIENRAQALNQIDVLGGSWLGAGVLDLYRGAAHFDGRLRLGSLVNLWVRNEGVLTQGAVLNVIES